jgi:hypothetical protein
MSAHTARPTSNVPRLRLAGLGANLPEDAVYPTAFADGEGNPLSGANKYVVHFDKGKLPPADAFWSITMYDQDGFQVPNPIDRFAIGDRRIRRSG